MTNHLIARFMAFAFAALVIFGYAGAVIWIV